MPLPVMTGLMVVCAALLAASTASHAQSAASRGETDPDTKLLWTTKPVRVDPETQALPRAPARRTFDLYPLSLRVPRTVRVTDSTTFVHDGTAYRLTNVSPVPARMICREANGRRWACGLRARMALRSMISGKLIHCRAIDARVQRPVPVACVLGQESLAEELVTLGFARALEPVAPFLRDAQTRARNLGAGLWSDAETRAQFR